MAVTRRPMAPAAILLLLVVCASAVSGAIAAPSKTHPPPKIRPIFPPLVFAPPPPRIPRPPIRTISDLSDVCKVCTAAKYNTSCYSNIAASCLRALSAYRATVLKVPDNICSCYGVIAQQLLQYCPAANSAISYLGNCDYYCYYGNACPFLPTLYSLVSTDNYVPPPPPSPPPRPPPASPNSPPTLSPPPSFASPPPALPFLRGVAILNFLVTKANVNRLCYQLLFAPGSAQIVRATLNLNIFGLNGPLVVELFSSKSVPAGYKSCIYFPISQMRTISLNSSAYYVQVYTSAKSTGEARGQLLPTPRLFASTNASSVIPPAACGYPQCYAFVDLALTPASATFTITANVGAGVLYSAGIYAGPIGEIGDLLFPLFGPGIANASRYNGVTAPIPAIRTLLSNPPEAYVLLGSVANPTGQLRGQFSDRIKVKAVLASKNEIPASNSTGIVHLSATLGGGAVCFSLKTYGHIGNITIININQGNLTTKGALTVNLYYRGIQPSLATCVQTDVGVTAAILDTPNKYYVQLYTLENPLGALRGNIAIVH